MQTKEDIKLWNKYLHVIKETKEYITKNISCLGLECEHCPFSFINNGHDITCFDLGLNNVSDKGLLLSSCNKYLKGDITFLGGRLVEVEDAN